MIPVDLSGLVFILMGATLEDLKTLWVVLDASESGSEDEVYLHMLDDDTLLWVPVFKDGFGSTYVFENDICRTYSVSDIMKWAESSEMVQERGNFTNEFGGFDFELFYDLIAEEYSQWNTCGRLSLEELLKVIEG